MSAISIVELVFDQLPRLYAGDSEALSFESNGQLFTRIAEFDHWLGFYDWLRTGGRQIVGVRFRPDEANTLRLFEPFIGPNVVIDGKVVDIRTTTGGEVVNDLSDDADFGGNTVYRGSSGGLAIAFFSPHDWNYEHEGGRPHGS